MDDGSSDATADLARGAGARILSLSPNRGKAKAMLALSGTQRTDWAIGLLLLVAAAFGLGVLAGRLSAPRGSRR